MRRKKSDATNIIAKDCLASRVRYLNRVLSSIYDNELRRLGITVNQLNILVTLSKMEEASARTVGSFLQMDPSTISRNLERMRSAGWIESDPGMDARSIRLRVSLSGERLIEKAFPLWQKAQARARGLMGKDGIQALLFTSERMK